MKKKFLYLIAGLLLTLAGQSIAATIPYKINSAESLFAIVTHKGGVAKGLAHDHFIFAKNVTANLNIDETNMAASTFTVSLKPEDLVVDSPSDESRYYPEVVKPFDIKNEPFAEVSESDRKKITESMLADDQLDAAKFPEIAATLVNIRPAPAKIGSISTTHVIRVQFSIHGQKVEKDVAAQVLSENGSLRVLATTKLKFTEFNIKPVSLFFGAIKNQDEFDVIVKLVAQK